MRFDCNYFAFVFASHGLLLHFGIRVIKLSHFFGGSLVCLNAYICIVFPNTYFSERRYNLFEVKWKSFSLVWLFATPWTVVYHTPPSMGFSRQGYWSGLPFPSPEDLRDPEIEPKSPALKADALPSEPPGKSIWTITSAHFMMYLDIVSIPNHSLMQKTSVC